MVNPVMKAPRFISRLAASKIMALVLGMAGAFSYAQEPPATVPPPALEKASAKAPPSTADLSTLLQRGLFEEEGRRRLDEAASAYEALLAGFDGQKHLAATALFRLAEVRRQQDRKGEAIALYQRLLAEFPAADPLARLSRETLAALGAGEKKADADASSESTTLPPETEAQALQRLQTLAEADPEALAGKQGFAALVEACRNGWIEAGNFVFDHGFQVTHAGEWHGLLAAALQHGHTEMSGLLTERGMARTFHDGFLTAAVAQGNQAVFDFLMDFGVDANTRGRLAFGYDESPPETLLRNPLLLADDSYPALSIAVATRNRHMIQRLLDFGVDPDHPSTDTGVCPIHIAALMDDPALVRQLIDAGVSATSRAGTSFQKPHRPLAPFSTPLHVAARYGSLQVIDPLIKAGAALEAKDGDGRTPLFNAIISCPAPMGEVTTIQSHVITNLLIWGKADVNATDNEGRSALDVWTGQRLEKNDITPYEFSNSLGLFLGKGASPEIIPDLNQPDRTLLAVMREKSREWASVVSVLREHGAIEVGNTQALTDAVAQSPFGPRKAVLSRRLHYDAFAKNQGGIAFSIPEVGWFHEEIRRDENAKSPPTLEEILFEWDATSVSLHPIQWSECVIYRHDPASGAWKRLFVTTYQADNFPFLEWGDIIEFTFSRYPSRRGKAADPRPRASFMRHLGESLTRHVTIISEGREYPLTLEGKRAVYEPTTGKAPLLPVADLLPLLGLDAYKSEKHHLLVTIERKIPSRPKTLAWELQPSGEWLAASDEARQEGRVLVYLRDGDRLTPHGTKAAGGRDGCITFVAPGKLLEWKLPVTGNASQPGAGAPTLLQALATFYQPHYSSAVPQSPNIFASAKSLLQKQGSLSRPMLTHPDWPRVRVRRVASPGSGDSIIAPPWTSLLGTITADTPATEAAAADMPLQAGDIIEIPVLAETGAPWEGFGDAMSLLMAKALSLSVTVMEDGLAREYTFPYTPPAPTVTPAETILTSYNARAVDNIHVFTVGTVIGALFRDPMALLSLEPADKRPLPRENPEALWRCYLRNGDKLALRRINQSIE